jgi:hypothetical protein
VFARPSRRTFLTSIAAVSLARMSESFAVAIGVEPWDRFDMDPLCEPETVGRRDRLATSMVGTRSTLGRFVYLKSDCGWGDTSDSARIRTVDRWPKDPVGLEDSGITVRCSW